MFDLSGKRALVTGASGGIGSAIAKALASQGAEVALSGTRVGALEEVAKDISGKKHILPCNLSDLDSVERLVPQAEDAMGGIDILVNNAGLGLGGPIEEISFETYERMIAVNVTGVFIATQEAVRHMKAGGRIIHIGSSMTRYAAFPTASLYTLTKGAVSGFNRSLVRDLGPRGITVNTVHPGPTDTDMNPDGGPVSEIVGRGIAIGRYGQPREIASVVAFLASPEAAFVSGAEIVADGGFTA